MSDLETVRHAGEFGLIKTLAKVLPAGENVLTGIGDDAAVLKYSRSYDQLLATDMLVENTHFTRRDPPELVGRKALACNISDIAAMGGVPTFAVVSLGLPPKTSLRYAKQLYRGLADCARQFKVAIVGGDTVRAPQVILNVALQGKVEPRCLVLRKGARPGDWIFVSGPLGLSYPSRRHLTFTPRLEQARFLVTRFKPSAMMDISDGLAQDLNHMLRASRVGGRLWLQAIPRHEGATLAQALGDGEDYELLCTLPRSTARKLMRWQFQRRQFSFFPIGEITANPRERIHESGYSHF